MQPTRRARLQALIQEELSTFVPRELKDPRIRPVTFTAVEVTPDAGMATVYVTLLGGLQTAAELSSGHLDPSAPDYEAKELELEKARKVQEDRLKDCLNGLNSAKGIIRRHLGKILQIRQIPDLVFKADRGLENSTRVHELLKQLGTSGGESKS